MRRIFPLVILALVLWAIHVFFMGDLIFTGDEVRYVAYGLGVWRGEGFHPSDTAWREMLGPLLARFPHEMSPAGPSGPLIHSVAYPLLGSAAIFLAGLEGARWFSFAVCLAGLFLLHRTLRDREGDEAALAAVVAAALACPLLFYMRLFFAESLLFAFNCVVFWIFMTRRHENPKNFYAVGLFLCLLPFVHVKMALEGAAGFVLLLLAARRRGVPLARMALLLGAALCMLGLYILYNKTLFGLSIGGASPAFPMNPLFIPDRVIVNLFDMRHGLIPNAPHLLFGLIGLCLGGREADGRLRDARILFGAYFFTMLWANGSEAYAARNWAAAMPFVAYGFARWYRAATTAQFALSLPVMLLSVCVLAVAVRTPDAFLESRNYSAPFDVLNQLCPLFHFGYFLPYDFLDHLGAKPNGSLLLGLAVLGVTGAYALGQMLCGGQRRRALGAGLQVAALCVALFFALVEKVEVQAVNIVREPDRTFVNVLLDKPRTLAFLKMDNPDATMTPWGFFLLGLREAQGVRFETGLRASRVTPLPPFAKADMVLVVESVGSEDRLWLRGVTGASLYARRIALPFLDE